MKARVGVRIWDTDTVVLNANCSARSASIVSVKQSLHHVLALACAIDSNICDSNTRSANKRKSSKQLKIQ